MGSLTLLLGASVSVAAFDLGQRASVSTSLASGMRRRDPELNAPLSRSQKAPQQLTATGLQGLWPVGILAGKRNRPESHEIPAFRNRGCRLLTFVFAKEK